MVWLGDNIINFGEQLPRPVLVNAQDHSRKADVVIAIGTSLRVEPAASLVSTKLGSSPPGLPPCDLLTRHDTTLSR